MDETSIIRITKHIGGGKRLRLLLWKNFLIQIRHKLDTFIEIIWPLCFIWILIYVQSGSETILHPAKSFKRFDLYKAQLKNFT